jgi:hypothetical protein
MLDPEIRREVRREVRTFMNIILNCLTGESTTEDQEIDQVFPGAPKLAKRPVVHPFGFVSRAPAGKVAVTAQVGEHPGARIILGVRDSKRAEMSFLEEGEACLYSETGERIVLRKDKVQLGSENADNPVVLGTELVDMLTQIIELLKQGQIVFTTAPGQPTAPNPAVVAQLEQLAQTFLSTADTSIISQRVFAERKKQ